MNSVSQANTECLWCAGPCGSDITVDGAYIALEEQQKHLNKYSIQAMPVGIDNSKRSQKG